MQLHEFQERFIESIHSAKAAPLTTFAPKCRLMVEDGLSIYSANMNDGLVAVLRETYATIHKLVGDAFFNKMAGDFVKDHLPTSSDLNLYGSGFAAFIQTYEPARSLGYLSDVAAFDWDWNHCFFSIDEADLDPSAFASLSPEDLQKIGVSFKDSVRLLQSDYPVDKIWEFCNQDSSDKDLHIDSDPVCLLLWRPSLDVKFLRLSELEHGLIRSLKQGTRFLDSLEQALEQHPSFDTNAFLQKLLSLNLIKSITFHS